MGKFRSRSEQVLSISFYSYDHFLLSPELDLELITSSPKLEHLDLEENPLSRDCEEEITKVREKLDSTTSKLKITMSKRELEDWEDLNI